MKGNSLCTYSPAEQTNPWYAALSDREKHTLLFWDSYRRVPQGDEPEELVDLSMNLSWSSSGPAVNLVNALTPGCEA